MNQNDEESPSHISNYEAVKTSGFRINSQKFDQIVEYYPDHILSAKDDSHSDQHYDYVCVCTKALPNYQDPTAHVKRFIKSENTVIILMQNGIGIEEPFKQAFPNNTIISCVIRVDATQIESGIINHGLLCRIVFGVYPSSEQQAHSTTLEELNSFFLKCSIESVIAEDIQLERWKKVVWNAAVNSVSVLCGGAEMRSMVSDPKVRKLLRDVMTEGNTIAEAYLKKPIFEEPIEENFENQLLNVLNRTKPVYASMVGDFQNKSPMEIQVIVRNPIEVAKSLGIKTPVLDAIYAMLSFIEKHYFKPKKPIQVKEHGMRNTGSWMDLQMRHPDIKLGLQGIGKIRMGCYWTAQRLAKAGLIPKMYIERCPFCNKNTPETIEHMLIECFRWNSIRHETTIFNIP
ncbi:hypothetical protein BB560_006641 [Smittium megazygosporum]|uniref:2-dehydropantoate 2-reductase n=1 Tax=Smittium megazygosporum TaxID=133381 RepID=A0A2T9Y2S7_9FUNG|nr:hypothetical protein BB560_006641 [Smittium megazygosporum]